jgi:hypothetical protein
LQRSLYCFLAVWPHFSCYFFTISQKYQCWPYLDAKATAQATPFSVFNPEIPYLRIGFCQCIYPWAPLLAIATIRSPEFYQGRTCQLINFGSSRIRKVFNHDVLGPFTIIFIMGWISYRHFRSKLMKKYDHKPVRTVGFLSVANEVSGAVLHRYLPLMLLGLVVIVTS